jgi:hypothetical protein
MLIIYFDIITVWLLEALHEAEELCRGNVGIVGGSTATTHITMTLQTDHPSFLASK